MATVNMGQLLYDIINSYGDKYGSPKNKMHLVDQIMKGCAGKGIGWSYNGNLTEVECDIKLPKEKIAPPPTIQTNATGLDKNASITNALKGAKSTPKVQSKTTSTSQVQPKTKSTSQPSKVTDEE